MKQEIKDNIAEYIAVALCIIVSSLIILLPIFCIVKCDNTNSADRLKKEAIERNYAEYNLTNGEWQWREKAR